MFMLRILDWILPPTCLLCGSHSDQRRDLCKACEADLPWVGTACYQCALPITGGTVCGLCLKNTPPYDRTIALCYYRFPMPHLVTGLKFQKKLSHAQVLGNLLADRMEFLYVSKPDVLIPVPLHPKRLRQRGYNQALELARPIAKRLNMPIDFRSCQRIKATEAQTGIPAKERMKNMKGAFSVSSSLNKSHVVLIDDVMTTGSTVIELSRVLRESGVKQIDVVCCARTTQD